MSIGSEITQLLMNQGTIAANAAQQQGQIAGQTISSVGQQIGGAITAATSPQAQEYRRLQAGRKVLATALKTVPPKADGTPDYEGIATFAGQQGFSDVGESFLSSVSKNKENLAKLDQMGRDAQKAVQEYQAHQLATIGDAAFHSKTPDEFTSSVGLLALHGQLGKTPQENEQQAQAILARADQGGADGWQGMRNNYLKFSPAWQKEQEERAKPVTLPRAGSSVVIPATGQTLASSPLAPEKPTEASLAADAANPKSPTAGQSKAALAALQAPTEQARTETARHNKEMERISALTEGKAAAAQRETERHNKAMETANNPLAALTGGSGATPTSAMQAEGAHGNDFLKTLPPSVASEVKAYAEGRRPFPAGFALKSPYFQSLIQMVGQYDPTFDAVNYNARSKTRNDFTSGKSAQTINALNTVTQHLSRLSDSADALNNSWSPTYNSVANFLSQKTGNKQVTQFETDKKAVVDELTRAWRQSGGTEGDIKSWSQVLDAANSPAQLHGAIAEMGQLLEGKLSALESQYQQGMGTTDMTGMKVVTPEARATLSKLEARAGGSSSAATPKEGTKATINGRQATWKTVNGKTGWYAD